MASLVFTSGANSGQEVELTDQVVLLGRMADCGIMFSDPAVSSHHAQLRFENNRWQLFDLGSSNGTLVNGKDVDTATLKDGDLVEIGTHQMRFQDSRAPGRPAKQTFQPKAPPAPAPEPERPARATASAPVAPPPRTPRPSAVPAPTPAAAPPPVPPPALRPAAPVVVRGREATAEDIELVEKMRQRTDAIRREVAKVIVGQQEVLDQVLMALIAGGHGLLVGLPGMAKTLMVRTVAQVLDLEFKRIQFTPDLMPTDIIGTEVLETNRDTGEREFRFIRGPLFCNLLLADEINRTPPKTQSALLEAMQEHRVTAGNVTYRLEEPFFVLATQNPIEQEGTYPLPEAQLDRFMFNIWIDYPQEHEEEIIVSSTTMGRDIHADPVLAKEEVLQLQEVVRKVPVSEHVTKYAVRLVRASRPAADPAPDFIKEYVSTGAGPRAGQYLILAAKARAVLEGRIHVSCLDIQRAAIPVLRHRVYTNFAADSEGLTSMDLIRRLLDNVPQPSERDYA